MTYKGYSARVEFDDEDMIFHGEVTGIRDVVTFQGKSVDDLQTEFQNSVDDYLEFCAKRNEEPDKPYSGRFVARVSPEIHKKMSIEAKKAGISLNTWLNNSLQRVL